MICESEKENLQISVWQYCFREAEIIILSKKFKFNGESIGI